MPASQADAPPPDYLLCPFNAPDLLRHLFHSHGPRIAAMLADLCPVRGALSPATPAFAEQIRDGCARYGVLLIADEVVSSRAAPGGMAAAYGLQPDIVCLGKYIGGGLPIGAIAMRRDLGTCFASGHKPRLGHGGTLNGNPLSMTVGTAALTGFGCLATVTTPADLDYLTAAVDAYLTQ